MVNNVVLSATPELFFESFSELSPRAYAVLIYEEPGAMFRGAMRRAEFLEGIHVCGEFVV